MTQGPPPDPVLPSQPRAVGREYGEAALVELPAILLFKDLGWNAEDLFDEWSRGRSSEHRETDHEVILTRRLRLALSKLNPAIPPVDLDQAIEELTRDRSKLVPVNANQEIYRLLKDGVPVNVPDEHGTETPERVRVIDWRAPKNNDFLLASQFWISGDVYKRRCDLVG